MHEALWGVADSDRMAYDSLKYSWDRQDHSTDLAERHAELNERLLQREYKPPLSGSSAWKTMEERKARGEATSPIIVGFEGVSRGLHFDGIDTVYMLGLPRKPATYLHLAGRVGRLGQEGGKVISIVPKRSVKVLHAWSKQIGPGVKLRPEEVARVRSSNVLLPEEDVADEQLRDHPKKVLKMLPEGQEPFRMPMPQRAEEEPVPIEVAEELLTEQLDAPPGQPSA